MAALVRFRIFYSKMWRRITLRRIGRLWILALLLCLYCEFFIYYFVQLQCSWPYLTAQNLDPFIKPSDDKLLKVMLLADTHLLGYREGHWFDRLRREWQMQRAFQTSMTIHSPDVIFILGDIFDEGKWCDDKEYLDHLNRFTNMFSHSSKSDLQVVVGNHDIGFHFAISPHRLKRFYDSTKSSSVRMLRIKGSVFVLLNSMAFEGDHCVMCDEAESKINEISLALECSQGNTAESNSNSNIKCKNVDTFQYSRPILLQHFPMFRLSDENCTGPDSAPETLKHVRYRPKYDCLSEEATKVLLKKIRPRVVIDGHSHHFCMQHLYDGTPEWTIPSFSWRNKNNPSFLLAVVSSNNYAINKCYLPQESTVINSYIFGGMAIVVWFLLGLPRQVYLVSRQNRKIY